MALRTMEQGKHAFVEVAAAVTVDDCWRLVDTSERLQKHCVILENCCYGENELLVLNMARQGVFGDLTHAECAYLHDLRSLLFTFDTEGDWRRNYHILYNGNLYPTHGLGPVAEYLGVGRGDQFKFIVSTSSMEWPQPLPRPAASQRRQGGQRKIYLRRHEHFAHQDRASGTIHHVLTATRRGNAASLQPHQCAVWHRGGVF